MNILKIGGKVLEVTHAFSVLTLTRKVGCYFSSSYYVERQDGFKHNNTVCMSVYSKDFADRWWIKPLTK